LIVDGSQYTADVHLNYATAGRGEVVRAVAATCLKGYMPTSNEAEYSMSVGINGVTEFTERRPFAVDDTVATALGGARPVGPYQNAWVRLEYRTTTSAPISIGAGAQWGGGCYF